jgi:hypothetical protein
MILEILVLYFVGKPYNNLAAFHGKSKWGYAILGAVSYYVMVFIAAIILTILADAMGWEVIYGASNITLALMAIPFGILAAWVLRLLLKRYWEEKTIRNSDPEILDHQNYTEGHDYQDAPGD